MLLSNHVSLTEMALKEPILKELYNLHCRRERMLNKVNPTKENIEKVYNVQVAVQHGRSTVCPLCDGEAHFIFEEAVAYDGIYMIRYTQMPPRPSDYSDYVRHFFWVKAHQAKLDL